jgi:RNA polymerase sigma-70 factor (ECF subfamily)
MNLVSDSDFKRFYLENFTSIRTYIYAKCADIALAEDIAQEAFLRLWNQKDKVSLEKAKSFVFTVSGNLFIDHIRHEKVKNGFNHGFEIKHEIENPHFLIEMNEFKQKLESTIQAMPKGAREVFLLNRIEKLTYQQIADSLGLSIKAIEKRMQKALEIMASLKYRR